MVTVGYHASKAGPVGEAKPDAMMKLTKAGQHYNYLNRDVVMSSMGPICPAIPPHPGTAPEEGSLGIRKRFVAKTPVPDRELLKELSEYVAQQLRSGRFGLPLDMEVDDSFDTWIETTNYSRFRKESLRKVYNEIDDMDAMNLRDMYLTKSFLKDETYAEFKHARAINSRSDEFKTLFSPLFTFIEKEVFKAEEFIKKVPIQDRPQYILDRLDIPGAVITDTDFSRFEAAFRREVFWAVEFPMYQYFVKHTLNGKRWFHHVTQALGDGNVSQFKYFMVYVQSARMSGDRCTSLGNGFTNLMVTEFAAHKHGVKKLGGVNEGDDGANAWTRMPPDGKWFEKLGFEIKQQVHQDPSTMSFCGLIFDRDEKRNVTDPHEVLASFGWTTGRYARLPEKKMKALLRCKALSLAYQYPGTPIISALARYGLRVTKSIDIRSIPDWDRSMSMWEKDMLLEAMRHPILEAEVGNKTRQLVFEQYGILPEVQIKVEEYLNSKNDLTPINTELLFWPESWVDYYINYCVPFQVHGQICSDLSPIRDGLIPDELNFDWRAVPKFKHWKTGMPWRKE